jgi:hypothetical protein
MDSSGKVWNNNGFASFQIYPICLHVCLWIQHVNICKWQTTHVRVRITWPLTKHDVKVMIMILNYNNYECRIRYILTCTLYISNAQKNSILFLFRLHNKDHETWPSCFEKMFLSSLVFDDLGSLNKDYFKLRHLLHETCWITWARLVTEPVTYSCMWLLRYCAVIVNKQTACQHHTYIPWSFVFVVLKVVNVLKVCQFTPLQIQER